MSNTESAKSTESMKSKRRMHDALEHRSGEIPVDFGATPVTGIHISVVTALREHYGLERHPVRLIEPYQMLGEIDDALKDAMGIDTEQVLAPDTLFGFANEDWKEWRTPWGQDVLVPGGFEVRPDGEDLLIFPQGDVTAPPSGRMPGGGYYFDSIIRQDPIVEEELDPSDNLEEFGRLSDRELDHFRREVERIRCSGRSAAIVVPGAGLGDIALVPAPFFKRPKGIRDVEEWYVSLVARQNYIREVFESQTERTLENLELLFDVIGNTVDVAMVCGTDFGTQSSTFCSLDTFESLYAPYYRRVNDWIHTNTEWKTFKHSCGAIEGFMDAFINSGFDIINPVQLSAAGMDAEELKARYGDRITFWGGGVDTQKTLPFGAPEEVREEVLSRCGILSRDGGYVFNAIHNVQAKTPVENIAAMIDAVGELRGG